MRVMGIDNGLDGALVCLNSDGGISKLVMPTIESGTGKREYDVQVIVGFVLCYRPDHVFLEKAQAMPGQGVSSMFSIGNGYGIMRGIIGALSIPHTLVHPKTWQKVMFKDVPKQDTKAASVKVCKRLFPQLDWKASDRCRKAHDGLTDAALIAAYGMRELKVAIPKAEDTEF